MTYQDTIARRFEQPDALESIAQYKAARGQRGRYRYRDNSSYATGEPDIEGFLGEEYDHDAFRTYTSDAMGREALARTKTRLESALAQPNLTPSEREELSTMLSRLDERVKASITDGGGLMELLGFLDRGRQTVQAGLTDLFLDRDSLLGWASRRVGREHDTTEIGLSDYGSILTGDLERLARRHPDVLGRGGVQAFSHMLELAGWETSDGWSIPEILNRTAIFSTSLAGDILTDPLTAVTFGGAGVGAPARGAAMTTAVKSVIEHMGARRVAQAFGEEVPNILGRGGKALADTTAARNIDAAFDNVLPGQLDEALEQWAKTSPTIQALDVARKAGQITNDDFLRAAKIEATSTGAMREITESAVERSRAIIYDQLAPTSVTPSVVRDFAGVDPAWQALRREGFADLLPAYTLGGIRLGTLTGKHGWIVPNTIGVGRQITKPLIGKPWQHLRATFPALGNLSIKTTHWFETTMRRLGTDHLIKRGVSASGHKFLESTGIIANIDSMGRSITHEIDLRLAELNSVGDIDHQAVMRQVFDLIESGGGKMKPDDALAAHGMIGPTREVHDKAVAFATAMVNAMEYTFKRVKEFNPSLGNIENYIPHIPTEQARKIIEVLANSKHTVRGKAGDTGSNLLEKIVNAYTVQTRASTPGSFASLRERDLGVGGVAALVTPGTGDSVLLFDRKLIEAGGTHTAPLFGKAEALNKALMGAVRQYAKENPGVLSSRLLKEDIEFFETNAAKVFDNYLTGMINTLKVYEVYGAFERLGLAERRIAGRGFEIDVNETVNSIVTHWWDRSGKAGSARHTLTAMILDAERGTRSLGPLKKIKIGVEELEVPQMIAEHPEFKEHVRMLREGLNRARTNSREFARERQVLYNQLRKDGYSAITAEALAGGAEKTVLAEARRLLRMKTSVRHEFDTAVARVIAEYGHRLGPKGIEALRVSTQALMNELEASAHAAKDDILKKYTDILFATVREADSKYGTQEAAVLGEAELKGLAARLEASSRSSAEERVAALIAERDELASMVQLNNIPLTRGDGVPTELGRRLQHYEFEIRMAQALNSGDALAAQEIAALAITEAEADYARQAAEAMLADIEAWQRGGELGPTREPIKWPAMELDELNEDGTVTRRRFTPTEVARDVQRAYDELDHFPEPGETHPFFHHPAIMELFTKMHLQGGEVIATRQLAELQADLAERNLSQNIEQMHDLDFARSMAAQKEEYEAILAARQGKRGRPPEFTPHAPGVGVIGLRLNVEESTGLLPKYDPMWTPRRDPNTGEVLLDAAGRPQREVLMAQDILPWQLWRGMFELRRADIETALLGDGLHFADEGIVFDASANVLGAIRREDWPAVWAQLGRVDDRIIENWDARLHDNGMPTNLRLERHYDRARKRHQLVVVRTDKNIPQVDVPEFEELIRQRMVTTAGETVPEVAGVRADLLSHPEVVELVDQWITLEAGLEVFRQAKGAVLREAKAAAGSQRGVDAFVGAAGAAQAALRQSLRDSSPKGRRALREVLYAPDKTGTFRLTPEGKVLQRSLSPEEWLRLHNNAEYLAVLGELEAGRASSHAVQAVRRAHKFQQSVVPLFSQRNALRSAKDAVNDLTRVLKDEDAMRLEGQRETVEMLREFVGLVNGLTRFLPREGDKAATDLGTTALVFGREAPDLEAELGRARQSVKELKERELTVMKPNKKGTLVPKTKPVFSAAQAKKIRNRLDPFKPADGKPRVTPSAPTEGMIDFGVRSLSAGPLAGRAATPEVVDFFANWIDATASVWSPTAARNLRRAAYELERYWKTVNTVGRTFTFNARNLMGGLWNNMLIGILPTDPLYFKVAAALHTIEEGRRKGLSQTAAIALIKNDQIRVGLAAMQDEKAVLDSFFQVEFHQSMQGLAPLRSWKGKRQALNPLSSGFLPVRLGVGLMEDVENLLRATAFIKHYNPQFPRTAQTAASLVRAVHFDYSDLTTLERRIKRFVPFYVWAKRNFELQLRVMMERPEMIARYWKMQQALAAAYSGDEPTYDGFPAPSYFSPFAAPTSLILDKDEPYWMRIWLDPDLPVGDLWAFPLFSDEGLTLASVTAWMGNMLGPGPDLAARIFSQDGLDPGYDVQAPMPLALALKITDAVLPFYDAPTTHDGAVMPMPIVTDLFNTMFPWHRNLVEPFTVPRSTSTAQRMGFDPQGGTGLGDRAQAFLLEQLRGVGITSTTPRDAPGVAFDMNEKLERLLGEVERRGDLQTEEEIAQQRMQDIINRVYNP